MKNPLPGKPMGSGFFLFSKPKIKRLFPVFPHYKKRVQEWWIPGRVKLVEKVSILHFALGRRVPRARLLPLPSLSSVQWLQLASLRCSRRSRRLPLHSKKKEFMKWFGEASARLLRESETAETPQGAKRTRRLGREPAVSER